MSSTAAGQSARFYRRPRFWFLLLLVIAVGYASLVLTVWLGLNRLIFHPQKELAATPAAYNLAYDDLRLTTEDGLNLHAWFIPAPEGKARPQTILFLHGNAGNMASMLGRAELMNHEGFAVMMLDYRGYGQSQGSPAEAGLYLDSQAAWRWLTETGDRSPEQIIIWGYSLGGGTASWLASREPLAAGLVLESTFTSVTDVAAHYAPWLPTHLIMGQSFDTLSRLPDITGPLMVMHSPEDRVVPYKFGRQVFESYQGPKMFAELSGPHLDGFAQQGSLLYRQALNRLAAGFQNPPIGLDRP